MEDKISLQAKMLANRLQKRFRHLKKWAQRTGVGAFRLYDRDIPEIPLVLDFYGDCKPCLNTSLREDSNTDFAICGSLYKRPYEKDNTDEEQWLSAMKESIAATLGISINRVFLKQRQRQRGSSQYEKVSETRFERIVSEGGISNSLVFKVNLSDYLDTGLFPDRRLLRTMVRDDSAGKRVLNLFSYTGSFSVYAAAGGAVSTDSVDLSNTYLNWSRENFSLNGMSANILPEWDFFERKAGEKVKSPSRNGHKLIRSDVLCFIEKAITAKMRWDIIILDPPAFSNSKKMTDNFDLNRDIAGLLNRCLRLLAPGGKVFLSVNLRRNTFTAQELETQFKQLFKSDLRVTDLGNKIIDEDFRGRKMPKAFLIS